MEGFMPNAWRLAETPYSFRWGLAAASKLSTLQQRERTTGSPTTFEIGL